MFFSKPDSFLKAMDLVLKNPNVFTDSKNIKELSKLLLNNIEILNKFNQFINNKSKILNNKDELILDILENFIKFKENDNEYNLSQKMDDFRDTIIEESGILNSFNKYDKDYDGLSNKINKFYNIDNNKAFNLSLLGDIAKSNIFNNYSLDNESRLQLLEYILTKKINITKIKNSFKNFEQYKMIVKIYIYLDRHDKYFELLFNNTKIDWSKKEDLIRLNEDFKKYLGDNCNLKFKEINNENNLDESIELTLFNLQKYDGYLKMFIENFSGLDESQLKSDDEKNYDIQENDHLLKIFTYFFNNKNFSFNNEENINFLKDKFIKISKDGYSSLVDRYDSFIEKLDINNLNSIFEILLSTHPLDIELLIEEMKYDGYLKDKDFCDILNKFLNMDHSEKGYGELSKIEDIVKDKVSDSKGFNINSIKGKTNQII